MKITVDEKGHVITPYIVTCEECRYFRAYKDAPGYGTCQSNHTFDGAFRGTDYCSYGEKKGVNYT